jgi:hypothetical protein
VIRNGPYLVIGPVGITDHLGVGVDHDGMTALCRWPAGDDIRQSRALPAFRSVHGPRGRRLPYRLGAVRHSQRGSAGRDRAGRARLPIRSLVLRDRRGGSSPASRLEREPACHNHDHGGRPLPADRRHRRRRRRLAADYIPISAYVKAPLVRPGPPSAGFRDPLRDRAGQAKERLVERARRPGRAGAVFTAPLKIADMRGITAARPDGSRNGAPAQGASRNARYQDGRFTQRTVLP